MRFLILTLVGSFLSLYAVVAQSVSIGAIGDDGSGSINITYNEISQTLSSDYRLMMTSDSAICMRGTWQAFFPSQGESFKGRFNGVVDGVPIFKGSTDIHERPELRVEVENSCDYRIKVTVSVVSRKDSSTILARKDGSIPAATYCAADVENVNLGTLRRGESISSSFSVTKTGSGVSNVVITGADLDTSGIVHLGEGKSGVIIHPALGGYISGASWVLKGNDNVIPLVVITSASAIPGNYSSVLMLELNCN